MDFARIKDRLSVRLKNRGALVMEYIERSGQPLYSNLERIPDRFARGFYNQLIVAGISDAYDFCVDIGGAGNIFHKRLRSLDAEAAARLHKLIGIHHTVSYLRETGRKNEARFVGSLETAYGMTPREIGDYPGFAAMCGGDPGGFEIVFAKRAAAEVFSVLTMSPATLAMMMYFFIYSYQQFKADNPQFYGEKARLAG